MTPPEDTEQKQQHPDDVVIVARREPPPSKVNDTIVFGCAVVAAVSGLVFAVTLIRGGPLALYGSMLALGLFTLGFAIRRYFTDRFPDVEATEPRVGAKDVDLDEAQPPIAEVTPIGRRPFLARLLVGASGVFGVSLLAFVPQLGPRVGDALRQTRWRAGVRLTTTDGRPIRPEEIAFGGISTVWPEDAIGIESSAVVVMRVTGEPEPPTNLDWVVDGNLLAYSKVCTHAGCPVALFRERDNALFCPCHQSTFNARQGAVVNFGPAERPLPQLPLGVDEAGYLVALSDFTEQVGPAFG